MSKRSWQGVLLAGAGILMATAYGGAAAAEAIRSSASEGREAKKSSKSSVSEATLSDDAKMLKRLEQILSNQETILQNQQTMLQRFDAVMEELRIVKIRASQTRVSP